MEMRARTSAYAFPAEIEEGEHQERGALHELDGDAQVIGTELGNERRRSRICWTASSSAGSPRRSRTGEPIGSSYRALPERQSGGCT
eukprot:10760560-Heterocapsa_arctica.AAC.1